MKNLNIPDSFHGRIIDTFGEEGKTWLQQLPNLLSECEKHYRIRIMKPMDNLSYNFVALATQKDNSELIIKLGVPNKELDNEVNALEFMHGSGVVDLIGSNKRQGILLLEKLVPGDFLSSVKDEDKAVEIVGHVMKNIWKPITVQHTFPTTRQWFERLNNPIELPQSFSSGLVDRARQTAKELHDTMGESVLLHGDLHHYNILSALRQPWLAIDPKGVIGEREYELGALLRNPIPDIATTMDAKKVLTKRVDLLSELMGFDHARIAGWGFAQAVLAAIWGLDSGNNDNNSNLFWYCAQILAELT